MKMSGLRAGARSCAVVAALSLGGMALAVDRTWLGPTGIPPGDGVSFNDPLNWSPSGAPTSADAVIFSVEGGDVAFPAAFTNTKRLEARGVLPVTRLLLGGNALFLNSTDTAGPTRSLVVGPDPGDLIELEMHDGIVILDHSAVAVNATADATLRLLDGATLYAIGELSIGEDGTATLVVGEASTLIAGADANIARNAGSVGNAIVQGAGSSWAIVGSLFVGGSADGIGGTGSVLVDGGALSVGEALVVHPGTGVSIIDGALDAASVSLDGTELSLDATSTAVISEGAPAPVAGVLVGGTANGAISLVALSKLRAPLVGFEAGVGSTASATLEASRIECDELELGGGTVINATLEDGGSLAGEEAILAVVGPAQLDGLLALSNGAAPLSLGDSIRVVEAGTIDGAFAVATTPLYGGFNFVSISKQPFGGGVQIRAEIATLDKRLGVLPPTSDPLPGVPNQVAVATFGVDPRIADAAVTIPGPTREAPATVVVVINELPSPGGTPAFTEVASVEVDGDPQGLATGSLFSRGTTDIVVSSASAGTVTVIRNMAGTLAGPAFDISQVIDLGESAAGLGIADIDGQDGLDIVVAQPASGSFAVLINDGAGTFTLASTIPSGTGTQGVDPLDLDEDKDIDVVAMNPGIPDDPSTWTVTVSLNQLAESKGRFTGFAPAVSYLVGPTPIALASGDLNGDGSPEVVTANAGDATISILVNNGDGTFAQAVQLDCGGTPTALVMVDLDNDIAQDLDLALLVENERGDVSLTIFRNDTTDGILTLVPLFDAEGLYGLPAALGSGDADSDGPADIVTAGAAPNGVASGPGGGAISVLLSRPLDCPGALNGDGVVDGNDLGTLLGSWGPCPGCPADFNGDGVVNGDDLGVLLANWGPCS